MSKDRIYVIGDRGNGVLLVKTNPLRVVEISDEEIGKYSENSGGDGYAKVAAALWRVVSDFRSGQAEASGVDSVKAGGIESLVEAGVQLTDVAFAFAAEIGSTDAEAQKQREAPDVQAQKQREAPDVQAQKQREAPDVQAQKQREAPDVQAQKQREAPDVQAQKQREVPHVQAQKQREAPDVQAQKQREAPDVQVQKQREVPHVQAQKQVQVQAQKQITFEAHKQSYPPIESALSLLLGADGEGLRSAVLSDLPSK